MEGNETHLDAINHVLAQINAHPGNPFVLKGGTALYLCYSLDRFSEDIDLDAPGMTTNRELFKQLIDEICDAYGYSSRIGKDTETVQRAFIDYGNLAKPLKVEVSYRRNEIPGQMVCVREGVKVYTLDVLAALKAQAYSSRDKIRDLYDVTFLCTQLFDELNDEARHALQSALEFKDLDQFDYIVRTQKDDLIDVDLLETRFLESFDVVGLLSPTERRGESEKESEQPTLSERADVAREAADALNAGRTAQAQEERSRD